MPIHDWTRVDAGLYHTFHQIWTVEILQALNEGVLPPGYVALTDLKVEGYEPDVVALREDAPPGGLAVADSPPRAQLVRRAEGELAAYARKANRLIVRKGVGPVVAVLEVVSPGNKNSTNAVREFKAKALEFLRGGVSLLLIDPFPPTPRDPQGLHQVIWDEFAGPPLDPRPDGKPLTVASFDPGDGPTVYADVFAVGDAFLEAPLFLAPGRYVNVPLEQTYQAAWARTPSLIRDRVSPPPGTP